MTARVPPRRERGVALIAAVLVVALATVLVAAMLDRGEAARARTRNILRAEQGWQLMRGLEGWAALALRRDAEHNGVDANDDVWAQPLPPLDLPEARIQGRLRELGGCFNLNSMQQGGVENAAAVARFERLLRALKLDPRIAAQARDWIDADVTPTTNGAEDMSLMLRVPPYRAANRAYAHVSELRLLPAVDAEVYAVLAPQVCALPANTPMNLNTATVQGWMSLMEEIGPSQARQLARDGRARYTEAGMLNTEMQRLGLPPLVLGNELGFSSRYFLLEAEIVSDGIPYLYTSLLQRSPDGARVLSRRRGRG
ncbi:MAG: type II secretion system minor pseudopilin GspK [Chiayiivirga sp.]|jgi:general secretion pathway protein K|nr:type II secretion system minor pseudopilin GspK [Chiayiivirga sp.]